MQNKEKEIKIEYQAPHMEILKFDEMPHTLVETSGEAGYGKDLDF